MPVRWKVKQLLQAHGLSAYRLWKESGLAMGTAYRLVRGDTQSLNAETLDKVMGALRRLTGKSFELGDLVLYEPPAVFVVHHDRDVASVIGGLVRRQRPDHHKHQVQRLGVDGAVAAEFAAWMGQGLAFASEEEAVQHAAEETGNARLFVHAVGSSDLVGAFGDIGVIADERDR